MVGLSPKVWPHSIVLKEPHIARCGALVCLLGLCEGKRETGSHVLGGSLEGGLAYFSERRTIRPSVKIDTETHNGLGTNLLGRMRLGRFLCLGMPSVPDEKND